MKLNERTLKALTAPALGNQVYWDDSERGFGVRITANGAIAFVLNYRIDHRERRYTIGRYPTWTAEAARKEASRLRLRIDNGEDPLRRP